MTILRNKVRDLQDAERVLAAHKKDYSNIAKEIENLFEHIKELQDRSLTDSEQIRHLLLDKQKLIERIAQLEKLIDYNRKDGRAD